MVIDIDTVMSIEEKAKAYDDAIRKIQEIIIMDNAPVTPKEIGEYLFPNLKEYEDKKMLREIKRYIKEQGDKPTGLPNGNVAVADMLAWLEKQGKSNFEKSIQDGDNIVTNEDGTHFNVSQLERVSKKVTDTKETAKKFLKTAGIMDKNGELAEEYRLEKQDEQKSTDKVETKFKVGDTVTVKPMSCHGKEFKGEPFKIVDIIEDNYVSDDGKTYSISLQDGWELVEQNPTDKLEPKFKVGDWITDGNITIQIEAIKNDCYLYCGDCALYSIKTVDKVYHLWTLKDAKDGDVLAFDNDNIVIFKDLYNYTSFHSYCHIEDGIFGFSTDGLPDWWEDEGFKPATKEQSNILFQKMKEAGYELDADKKELKIIDWSKHIKYESNSPSIFTKESTWSEEDTFKVQRICKYLDEAKKYYADITEVRECIDWLKSLEERLKGENKELLLKDLEWCDMETLEAHCYNCKLFDSKNNVCKCIDLCKRPTSTFKGFYKKY